MKTHHSRSYNNIFITGMPGCGKTKFGRIYAYLTNREFIDFDDFFEQTLNTKISKIFFSKGKQEFRKLETKILPQLVQKNNTVVALGGGTLLAPENFYFLKNYGLIVSLMGLPIEQIAQNIWNDKNSPHKRKRPMFSQCQSFEQTLEYASKLQIKREQIYLKADLVLNQNFNSTDTLVLAIQRYEEKLKTRL